MKSFSVAVLTVAGTAAMRSACVSADPVQPVPLEWYTSMLKSIERVDGKKTPEGKESVSSKSSIYTKPLEALSSVPSSVAASVPTAPMEFLSSFKTPISAESALPQLSSIMSAKTSSTAEGAKKAEFISPFDPIQAKADFFNLLSQAINKKTGGLFNPDQLKQLLIEGFTDGEGNITGFPGLDGSAVANFNKSFFGSAGPISGGYNLNKFFAANGTAPNGASSTVIPTSGTAVAGAGFSKFIDFFGNTANFNMFKSLLLTDQEAATRFMNLLVGNVA